MGWGACQENILVERRRPSSFTRPEGSPDHRRPHCREYHWNIGAALSKTACLSLFFLAEAPRRLRSYALRIPEPAPYFSCAAAGGFRICACGHHYYDHTNVVLNPEDDDALRALVDAYGVEKDKKVTRKDRKPIVIRAGRRRRRWYWPF